MASSTLFSDIYTHFKLLFIISVDRRHQTTAIILTQTSKNYCERGSQDSIVKYLLKKNTTSSDVKVTHLKKTEKKPKCVFLNRYLTILARLTLLTMVCCYNISGFVFSEENANRQGYIYSYAGLMQAKSYYRKSKDDKFVSSLLFL